VSSPPPTAPSLPRRDRIAILIALGGVSALAWVYLVVMAVRMQGMDMDGMALGGSMLEIRAWTAVDFALMFLMWAVMMVGMMLPTAMPMTLVYAAVARKAELQGTPIGATAAFVAGYVLIWTLFSAGATAAQWALDQAALLSPMLVTTSPAVGAALLVAAGLYQLTPYKDACLKHCRAPAYFISEHFRPGSAGAFRMGLVHGAFCLGCCWALMGLLFFGGVMSLLWILAITAFVLAEKMLPYGVGGGRVAGFALIAAGVALLAGLQLR
jgi:predicted metal-binding membrane protein